MKILEFIFWTILSALYFGGILALAKLNAVMSLLEISLIFIAGSFTIAVWLYNYIYKSV